MAEVYADPANVAPGLQLYRRVRAGFILQGTTVAAWCRKRGLHTTNARLALTGAWDGPKGRDLRERLISASGISESTTQAT